MIATDRYPHVEIRSAAELRVWLTDNHARTEPVWLVTFLKHTGAMAKRPETRAARIVKVVQSAEREERIPNL